jgi:hypothetical protein
LSASGTTFGEKTDALPEVLAGLEICVHHRNTALGAPILADPRLGRFSPCDA